MIKQFYIKRKYFKKPSFKIITKRALGITTTKKIKQKVLKFGVPT